MKLVDPLNQLNVDSVLDAILKGNYLILRSSWEQRGSAGGRIMLEELCQLVRELAPLIPKEAGETSVGVKDQ